LIAVKFNFVERLLSFRGGRITLADLHGWFKWLFYYPGDSLIYHFTEGRGDRKTAEFFELTTASYGGETSFFVSLLAWCSLFYGLAQILDDMEKDADKFKIQVNKWREWYRIKFKCS